jgi:acyl-CoA reductase-like NAD-dependent aldehyde dehydrogenase
MAEIIERELIVPRSLSTRLTVGNATTALTYLLKGRVPPERRRRSLKKLADLLENNKDALAPINAIGATADFELLLAANAATENGAVTALSSRLTWAANLLRQLSEVSEANAIDQTQINELNSFLISLENELAAADAEPTDIAPA